MPRVKSIIHIGQHKTGTTSIQESLKINSDALAQKNLYVPLNFCGRMTTNHYELNMISLNADRGSPMKDKFDGEVSSIAETVNSSISCIYQRAQELGLGRIIWSNEGLSLLRYHEEYTRLADLFRPYSSQLIVVLCIRDREEFKVSWEKQLLRMGLSDPAPPADSYRYLGDDSWMLDWTKRLPLLVSVFDQVRIYRYSRKSAVRNFYDIIGINSSESLVMDELFLNQSD